jgi:hypothetical protein
MCKVVEVIKAPFWRIEVNLFTFLTPAPEGSEWPVSCSYRFILETRIPNIHLLGEPEDVRKVLHTCRESNPGR